MDKLFIKWIPQLSDKVQFYYKKEANKIQIGDTLYEFNLAHNFYEPEGYIVDIKKTDGDLYLTIISHRGSTPLYTEDYVEYTNVQYLETTPKTVPQKDSEGKEIPDLNKPILDYQGNPIYSEKIYSLDLYGHPLLDENGNQKYEGGEQLFHPVMIETFPDIVNTVTIKSKSSDEILIEKIIEAKKVLIEKANSIIYEVYPLWKQVNILRLAPGYVEQDKITMETKIDNVRSIINKLEVHFNNETNLQKVLDGITTIANYATTLDGLLNFDVDSYIANF